MTNPIGLTLEELRDQFDPEDVEDMTWRQRCYVVARGMGEIAIYKNADKIDFPFYSGKGDEPIWWPTYHESGKHAMRVLEALPNAKYVDTHIRYNKWTVSCNQGPSSDGDVVFAQKYNDLKEAITKAAAKAVLAGG